MRKILYSPGYGAGWTTGNDAPLAKFLLEYQPIIAFIEEGNKFSYQDGDDHPLLQQLRSDAQAKFGEDVYLYFGGAHDLVVANIPDGEQVLIEEYDGAESYRLRSLDNGWL